MVNDVTRESEENDESLKHIIKIVKMCRKGKYKQAFKFSKTPIPNSPNKTRWNAVYMMIYVLLKYKEFYSNIGLQYDELGKLLFFFHSLLRDFFYLFCKFCCRPFTLLAIHGRISRSFLPAVLSIVNITARGMPNKPVPFGVAEGVRSSESVEVKSIQR